MLQQDPRVQVFGTDAQLTLLKWNQEWKFYHVMKQRDPQWDEQHI
jgi:hypothetical protein